MDYYNKRTVGIITFNFSLVIIVLSVLSLLIGNVYVLCWLAIVQLILGILMIKERGYKLFSFPVIFVIFVFVFHVFRIFYAYLTNDTQLLIVFWYRDESSMLPAIRYYFITMTFLLFGIAYAPKKANKNNGKIISDNNLFFVGLILFAIGIVPKLMINYEQLTVSLAMGYLETYEVNLSGRGTIATLVYPGAFLILLSKRKNKYFSNIFMLLISGYEVVMMLSGNRIMGLSFLLTLYLLYFTYVKKLDLKNFIKYAVIAFILAAFLSVIRETRVSGISINQIGQLTINALKNNPITDVLCELGSTMNTLILSLKFIPDSSPHGFGLSYLMFVPNLIPRLDLGSLNEHLIFVYNFPVYDALGGDFIGEFYYNFSYFGVLCGFVIGRIAVWIDRGLNSYELNPTKTLMVLPIVLYSFSYIRGYFYGFRVAIYHILLIYLLLKVMPKGKG